MAVKDVVTVEPVGEFELKGIRTEAWKDTVGQVVLHIARHIGAHDLDRDIGRRRPPWRSTPEETTFQLPAENHLPAIVNAAHSKD